MDLKALRSFVETAREGNMSRAAERLGLSQPTISKQLKALEEELHVPLFTRSSYSIKLTEAGMLLRRRSEDILALVDRTIAECSNIDAADKGDIYVGAAESDALKYFAHALKSVQDQHPGIRCNIFSGNMDDVTQRLDKGLLDFAVVVNFVDLAKYTYLKLPAADVWGVVMRKDCPLAKRQTLLKKDLLGLPLIGSRQWIDQDVPRLFGNDAKKLRFVATYNLAYNAALMAREGIGYAVTFDKLADTGRDSGLCFRPITDVPSSPIYLIWRKYQAFTPQAQVLMKEMKSGLPFPRDNDKTQEIFS